MIVIDYQKADKPGVLVGTFTIRYDTQFGPRWDSGIKLFMKNGHRWVGFPSKSIKDEGTGKFIFQDLSGFDFKQDHDKWQKACLTALDAFCANGGQIRPIGVEFEIKPLAYKDD